MTESPKSQEHDVQALLARTESLILDLWCRTRLDWGFVSTRLADVFRRERGLGAEERRFVAETLYGLVRQVRRVDEALALGGCDPANRAPDRERIVGFLLLEGLLSPTQASVLCPGVEWSAVAGIDEVVGREKDPARRIARRRSLPDWLARRLVAQDGAEADALAEALNQRAPMTIRTNTLKGTQDELLEALRMEGLSARPGTFGPWAVHVDSRTNLFGLKSFREGRFEAQDEGSQLIAELVAPPPKAIVVDYCAGAGGKTLALAQLMENKGRLVACDVDGKKLSELKKRCRRAGASNVQSVALPRESDAAQPAVLEGLTDRAHRVLVDAPCTGVGALRRNPEARWRLSESSVAEMVALQTRILDRAVALVRPGGRLIYATCSLLGAENREVVTAALARHREFSLMPAKDIWGRERALGVGGGDFLEVDPHRHGTDGFFAAVLRRAPMG